MVFILRVLILAAGIGASASATERTLLILGDSLSAAHGIDIGSGWVSLLEQRLVAQGYRYRIVNASISGDTSRGARARLEPLLAETRPDLTIVELGGNDGLRGIPLDELRRNLDGLVAALTDAGSAVLLLSIRLPPNYGTAYIEGFEKIYADVGEQFGVPVGGFLLEGVALRPELMQDDGIHPTAEAQPLILENVWKDLRPMLDGAASPAPAP